MTLLLHTSTATVSVGLADSERSIAREEFSVGRDLAATFAERIRQFVQRASVQASERASDSHASTLSALHAVDNIVVHTGPGSFTGLRIGVTTANALAYALNIPIVGIAGPVATLEELLERSRKEVSRGNITVPVYERDPLLGPLPLHIPPA